MKAQSTKHKAQKNQSPTPSGVPLRDGAPKRGSDQPKVEYIEVGKINPAPYNPRKHLRRDDPDYQRLRRSIEEFGNVGGMVWNRRSGYLVGGHIRLRIMRDDLRMKKIPVTVVDLSPAKERALNLVLNKSAGEFDQAALVALMGSLKQGDEVDMDLTGFGEAEIEKLLGISEKAEGETGPQLGDLLYRIVVDCVDEAHQRKLLDRFNKEKLSCRALIS